MTGIKRTSSTRISLHEAQDALAAERSAPTWARELKAGRATAVVTFAGQGAPWLDELAVLCAENRSVRTIVACASTALKEAASTREFRWSGLFADGLDVLSWIDQPDGRPDADYLGSTTISQPGIFLAQVARYTHAFERGLGAAVRQGCVRAVSGHSQGVMAAVAVSEAGANLVDPSRIATYARYMAWQGLFMADSWRQTGRRDTRPGTVAMVAIAGPTTAVLQSVVDELNAAVAHNGAGHPVTIALHNTRTRHVVSGHPADIVSLRTKLDAIATREKKARKAGRFGGSPLQFQWDELPIDTSFHSPFMAAGVDPMLAWTRESGFSVDASDLTIDVICPNTGKRLNDAPDLVDRLVRMQFCGAVKWSTVVAKLATYNTDVAIDFGPGVGVARLLAVGLRGTGARTFALAEPSGRDGLWRKDFRRGPKPVCYADYAPRRATLADGRVVVDNRYTRATGQSPIILPGMTPTTVDVPIVAAAANAGFTAEIAGGGQVTDATWDLRVEELKESLQPGAEVVFNALYLDRYLWDLHCGGRKLVQKARKAGAPICGVTISAGIPDKDEAVALLDEFAALGMYLNAFKPGTVQQIDAVLAIAKAARHHTIFMHLEGGKAGGHHSWEDLEALLLARYHRIRAATNVVLCVGGGIANEERSTELLTGTWAHAHGLIAMPVDAVFLGTLAMACKEATASPQVKRALADAAGTDRWVYAGQADGGVTSGKSQLNADIHYIDNAAARCGRLLDAVAGSADKVAAQRDAIIEALNATAKPYFGDFEAMSWREVLVRMAELTAVGRGGRYEDGVWPDVSYRKRFAVLVQRAEARLHDGAGSLRSLVTDAALADPGALIEAVAARFENAATMRPTPVDADFFTASICRMPGKPVNFVPVIDADVRRWYKSDSLWQAQDDRYDADAVLIIPGPDAVAGIIENEPVADLLRRFDNALLKALQTDKPVAIAARKRPETTPTLPGAIVIEHGEGVQTWRVAGEMAHDAWFAPFAARFDGPIATYFAAKRVHGAAGNQPNVLRDLCPSEPGATLWIEARDKTVQALTWRTPAASGESVRVVMQADRSLSVAIAVPECPGADATAWTWTVNVDVQGRCHVQDCPADAVRGFYHHNLFGRPIAVVPLLDAIDAKVEIDATQARAYAALSHANDTGIAASMVFSLAFKPLMSTLSCDELSGGLLRLVHLDNRIETAAAWPPAAHDTVSVRCCIDRVENTPDGVVVAAQTKVASDSGAPLAAMTSRFLLRGVDLPGFTVAADENLHREIVLTDAAACTFLADQRWLTLDVALQPGDSLVLTGNVTEKAPTDGPATFTATGQLLRDRATIGRIDLPATHAKKHPVMVVADLLATADTGRPVTAKTLATETTAAISDPATWAEISGDLNPIHRGTSIARLAGLPGPIVHGMWTAARAHAFVVNECAGGNASRVTSFEAAFVAPLFAGEPITLQARRESAISGAQHISVAVSVQRNGVQVPVLRATATLAAPVTAYVFPGQGIQQPGMGMQGYGESKAARDVWDRADAFTRSTLGYSLLRVVRDNPKSLIINGRTVRHAKGVLHLTQFTQVAMAVLARAQVAQLREAGVFIEGSITCGHSVGEYNALSAVAEVLPLEAVIEIVWMRGMTMHTCVPRDENGHSGFAMGVIRPHNASMTDADARALVQSVAEETGGFVEIVNYNVKGRQYATVGDSATLDVLAARLADRAKAGGKTPWVPVPGIDVPFHSSQLLDGVAAFRMTLDDRLPRDDSYLALVDRYVPNVVALPFSLDRSFVEATHAATDRNGHASEAIAAILADFDAATATPATMARTLVIELLAYQFASPVRWIETQDVLFAARSEGGLGVQQLIEIGVGYQPTVANMAKQTLGRGQTKVTILNAEANAPLVFMTDEDAAEVAVSAAHDSATEEPATEKTGTEETGTSEDAIVRVQEVAAVAAARQVAVDAPKDQPVSHGHALRTLLALQARVRVDQVRGSETIDELFGGVSSRRNQVLLDIGAEFCIGAIDGAHERPIADLATEIAKRAPAWSCPGGYLGKAWDEGIRHALGRAKMSRKDVAGRLEKRYGLGSGLVGHALNSLVLLARDGDSVRGGDLGSVQPVTGKSDADALLDTVCADAGKQLGLTIAPLATGSTGGGAAVDAAVVAELEDRILGADGVLMNSLRDVAERLGHSDRHTIETTDESSAAADMAIVTAEHGDGWTEAIAPRFSADQHVAFLSQWAWAPRDVALLYHGIVTGKLGFAAAQAELARLAVHAKDRRFAKTAAFYAQKAENAGRNDVAAAFRGVLSGDSQGCPALVPSRPSYTVDANGHGHYAELPDHGENAVTELIDAMFDGDDPHVSLIDNDANDANDANETWRTTLENHTRSPLAFAGRTALVTGASPGSIAIEVVRHLLRGGARVVVTTSSPRRERMAWYRRFYQQHAAPGAELHIVPFNAASNGDVDALIRWLFDEVTEPNGATVRVLKPAFAPDLVVPFAAIGDIATLDQLGPRAELAVRAMLLSVERLVAGIATRYRDNGLPARRCHVVLPMSPNHGAFGGDGAYAETKAALEVLCNKWVSENDAWGHAMTLVAARIGWVRGTGLMDANDPVAAELETRTGCRTFANAEMGWLLAGLCEESVAEHARRAPLWADLTGGFAAIDDVKTVVGTIRADLEQAATDARRLNSLRSQLAETVGYLNVSETFDTETFDTATFDTATFAKTFNSPETFNAGATNESDTVTPLPGIPREWPVVHTDRAWPAVTAQLENTVVIVSAAEVGPLGSSRTRWQVEADAQLSDAGVLEMAWTCGLVRFETSDKGGGWIDAETDEPVAEHELGARYRDQVMALSGIRWTEPDSAGFDPSALPVLAVAYLDRDFTFQVANEDEARSFEAADPEHTIVRFDSDADQWLVTRQAGAEIRVPRIAKLDRRVLGTLPAGFDLARFGIPADLLDSASRIALFNLVATADAFLAAGMTPEELLAHVHPARVANTQGSGIGGMDALTRLYTDLLLDRERQPDALQETLINVVAAHVVQGYVGSYGAMSQPVGACATAAVSLEQAIDKILTDRAEFVVAGAFDDVGYEGAVGFQDMAATCDTGKMTEMGLAPDQMSRPNDVRRRGFVEGQGGGTLLVARGDVALKLGLPVRGVLAYAGSFSDGIHKSVPAPGLGVVAAAMGTEGDGKDSALGRALSRFGLVADDIGLVYKHDTSTNANDVNENAVHHHIQTALGRTEGNPLFAVSQKALTGHSKGGAAAWQSIGCLQALATGVVPGNPNLDSVDGAMQAYSHVHFTDRSVDCGPEGLKAGLVTSLGFGHVGAIALLVHPAAFVAMLTDEQRTRWQAQVDRREARAHRARWDVLMGRSKLFTRRGDKRFTGDDELAMLLDGNARLSAADSAGVWS